VTAATAFVFDLDGTLVDSTADIAAAVNRTLAARGLPALPAETVREFTGFGADELVRRSFAAAGVELGAAELEAETARYLADYDRHPVDHTVVLHDAATALPELRRRGARLGVCTNKETELARTVLAAMGLEAVIDSVVGADSVARRKPHPEHLHAVLDELGARPEETLYVGDTAVDAETAEAAGVRLALVAWGLGEDAGARRIACFADLLDPDEEAA
jgi:phosphoglycolate phosphatase